VKIERLADALVSIDGRPWSRVRARKAGVCRCTGQRFEKGALIYRPFDSGVDRWQRILASEIDPAPIQPPTEGAVSPSSTLKREK